MDSRENRYQTVAAGIPHTFGWQEHYYHKYREYDNAKHIPTRLMILMRSYYEDASQRITDLNHMRFMYEESPHYETGYLMHELIERYKKMVEELSRLVNFKSSGLFDSVGHTEMIQKLYFEVYHLVNMIHEIPLKWKGVPEFRLKEPGDTEDAVMNKQLMQNYAQIKRREERRKKKLMKKRMEMIKQGLVVATEKPLTAKKEPYNPHWPLDYGWEIEKW